MIGKVGIAVIAASMRWSSAFIGSNLSLPGRDYCAVLSHHNKREFPEPSPQANATRPVFAP